MLSKTDFAIQVRQALEHLHDFAYLQDLALTGALLGPGHTLDRGVRQLRSELLGAVEQLCPPSAVGPRAKERRPYALLYGRYVQGLGTADLVEELAISVRQLRREHKRALGAVTDLLWGKLASRLATEGLRAPGLAPVPESRGAAQVEAEQLISRARAEDLSLPALVGDILTTLAPVASRHDTLLRNSLPEGLPLVRADRIVLRQGLMELISHGMDRAASGQLVVEGSSGMPISLRITAAGRPQPQGHSSEISLEISRRLIASLGGRVETADLEGRWQATVELPPAREVPILVMDDNQGLIELFRRYLAGGHYRVVEAHTTDQALAEARQGHPKLIVLDIMMPEQDGWEILQRLRAAPETRDLPILICSVLNEPEIAYALGASDYLTKPITQDVLLTKVEQWCGPSP